MNRTIPSCTAKNVYLETIANCYAVQYEMLCAFNFNVVSTQGNKDVQLSVSTMLNNNSHVKTKVSFDQETTSLSTSTKTSDYHSAQSTGSSDSEPQKPAGLKSKTETSSPTKISSGYYSDQSDSAEAARPTAQYHTLKTGVFLV